MVDESKKGWLVWLTPHEVGEEYFLLTLQKGSLVDEDEWCLGDDIDTAREPYMVQAFTDKERAEKEARKALKKLEYPCGAFRLEQIELHEGPIKSATPRPEQMKLPEGPGE